MNQPSKRSITVEDLLSLKRAERPAPAFWDQFDRELRAKQLAALVGKRPWWQRLPRAFSGLSRYQIPLGATAILALTFISIREYQSAPAPAARAREVTVVSAGLSSATPALLPVESSQLAASGAAASSAAGAVEPTTATEAGTRADISAPAEFAGVMPLFVTAATPGSEDFTPSARNIAANLAAAQEAAPAVSHAFFGGDRGFETRALPARTATVEPLTQITSPSEARRARLLSAMAVTNAADLPAHNVDRVASRLSDDRLYDQIHRFGARGDRLLVKF